ncbi:MAG: long-chain fatty acid--CoA ligase [Candidatus Methanolliviera hydrocarbonicum]|uniref:Long-chain fatty acid--CoA ligase n=1 Tax=Candidatus Methanolliviera hydrocarbonicum TaxID=2491085 RepID=A0A520KVZ2_9EURY|nr:MAG: long-chain fatty acid--CoA ligase [Candidatus Methanolliviera hydrocarbonicum]
METKESYSKFRDEWGIRPVPPLPNKPIYKIVAEGAKKWPKKDALICLGSRLTYKELDELSNRLAFALADRLGVKKGDRVAAMLPNCIQHTLVFFAVNKLGAIHVPCNVMYKSREVEQQLNDCGAKVFITLGSLPILPIVEAIKDKTSVEHIIVTNIEDFATSQEEIPPIFRAENKEFPGTQLLSLLEKQGELPEVKITPSEDLSLILYTAGTTGVPKGVMETHKTVWSCVHPTKYIFDFDEEDVNLQIMPMFHCSGYCLVQLPILYSGGTSVLVPLFDAKNCLRWIQDHRVTRIFAPPTFFVGLMNVPEIRSYDLSGLKTTLSCGAPQPPPLRGEWKGITGLGLLDGYGLTETMCQGASVVSMPNKYKPGAIGPAFNCEVKIADERGKIVPRGTVGEFMFRGDGVAKGYWNKPEETKVAFLDDGWLHTGDAGYMDDEDFMYFVDRYKDLIVASGYNVAPAEVEGVLMGHSAVKEAGVVGVPDEYRGETVRAFVSLKEGYKGKVTEEEIIEHCKKNLATFKVPKSVEFIEEIPKNPVGKILRRALREEGAKKIK